jgi:hypothetical protein
MSLTSIDEQRAAIIRELLPLLGWRLRVKTWSNGKQYAYACRRVSREVGEWRYLGPLADIDRIVSHIALLLSEKLAAVGNPASFEPV